MGFFRIGGGFARSAVLGWVVCLLAACEDPFAPPERPPVAAETQHAYFPLRIGQYAEYRIDSIIFDFGPSGQTVRDTVRLQAREEVVDTFRDETGLLQYRIERYERPSDTVAWALRRVWAAARTTTQAIRQEENLRFLRLVFPLTPRMRWDGNRWIDPTQEIEVAGERLRPFVGWSYRADSVDVSAQIGTFRFDSVLVVTEVDYTNAIERRLSKAWYARHVGLVRREQWILDSQYCNQTPPPADCLTRPWELKGQKGYILRQTLLRYH
ncbi:MAG: hypothetical protein RMJ33_09340 [Saprospiraceae bacterium]|nr:hypothetical protein [Saprospiraceae bacterium]MDW8230027.1 hypothetical protein [Saprospiraceae bacterium]